MSMKIHCYQMDHSVPCNSYGIHLVSQRLKDEYQQELAKFQSDKKQISPFRKRLPLLKGASIKLDGDTGIP